MQKKHNDELIQERGFGQTKGERREGKREKEILANRKHGDVPTATAVQGRPFNQQHPAAHNKTGQQRPHGTPRGDQQALVRPGNAVRRTGNQRR